MGKKSKTKTKPLTKVLLLVVLFMLCSFLRYRSAHNRLPRGCNVVRIWSHRGHLDASAPESRDWTCDHVLMELAANDIRHLDVDLLYYKGESVVAHPTEMGDDLGDFSPSPCSKLPLKMFIQKLKRYYGPEKFYLTMEPKAAWTEEGDFLAPPEDVIQGILDVLDEEPIPNLHCGIILQAGQLQDSRVSSLEYPINQHCSIILPLKRSDAPLGGNNFPTDKYRLIMPTVELFGNADGDRFLKKSEQQGLPIILWIVDTLSLLHKALLMRGVQGVISNHPVRLKRMYEEICGSKYTGGIL